MPLIDPTVPKQYLPWDKSLLIRYGALDILEEDTHHLLSFLVNETNLSSDLLALQNAAENWPFQNKPIFVREAGTLYRILRFATWKQGPIKEFVREGTLKRRAVCNNPGIVQWSQEDLLTLDNKTSQWATAAVLLGDERRLPNPPYKLALTYEAIKHWKKKRAAGEVWEPRIDETIKVQAETYLAMLQGTKPEFVPLQSEDYCFARAFGYIDDVEGEKRWPSLRGHETDRVSEMKIALQQAKRSNVITSQDHRVVQAVAMLLTTQKRTPVVDNPKVVNKSWPQFWSFLQQFNS